MGKQSKTAKGSKRLYEISAAAWFDLLGYGSMLAGVNFDPTKEDAQNALIRLNDFHTFLAKHANRYLHVHAINDGSVIFRDLSPRAKSVTFDFLDRLIKLFQDFNSFDKAKGYPGARMVIASGFRIRIKDDNKSSEHGHIVRIKEKLREKTLTPVQAVDEAYKTRPYFGLLPELQANFAFTKAYLVDNAGSKGGFGGPNCFIDLAFFADKCDWIEFDKIIDWENMGMKARFGLYKNHDSEAAGRKHHEGILDAFEIAEKISTQSNVTNLLRQNTIKVNPLIYR